MPQAKTVVHLLRLSEGLVLDGASRRKKNFHTKVVDNVVCVAEGSSDSVECQPQSEVLEQGGS